MRMRAVVSRIRVFILVAVLVAATVLGTRSARVQQIDGVVQGGGGPIAIATVTLWAAGQGTPRKLGETSTRDDGGFALRGVPQTADGAVLYLVARGGQPKVGGGSGANDAIGLLALLGAQPPAKVVVYERTTIASVWTATQFLEGTAMSGHALGLTIAAGNVPNFVDLGTGGWGEAIQGPLNSGQTPTMANFATLADLLAGCVTRVIADACAKLFAAATLPKGNAPTDTLAASQSIARYPWYQPDLLFALLGEFYPVPQGKNLRPVPYMPYLNVAPSAWVLPLKFDGGGYRAGGGAMFDSEGNLWVGDNFTVGWQGSDSLWQGPATKFAPNGKPLSPI